MMQQRAVPKGPPFFVRDGLSATRSNTHYSFDLTIAPIRATPIALVVFDYRASQSNTHCSEMLASVACRVLKNGEAGIKLPADS